MKLRRDNTINISIIKRIAKEVDNIFREEQVGFRAGRSITEQIFVLRNIVEQ